MSDTDAAENNRRILATYPREKLLQFLYDCAPGKVGEKPYTELSDEELRGFTLAITMGP